MFGHEPTDGVRCGGGLEPAHGSATAGTFVKVVGEDVSQKPRPPATSGSGLGAVLVDVGEQQQLARPMPEEDGIDRGRRVVQAPPRLGAKQQRRQVLRQGNTALESTPKYLSKCVLRGDTPHPGRGGGTAATRRVRRSCGSNTTVSIEMSSSPATRFHDQPASRSAATAASTSACGFSV